MGHDLYRMVRAGMPSDWTAAERVVALILADVCNDRTRTGFITNEQLCMESGLKPGSLRTILARLGARGFEMRVELAKGKDGRPVYATSGRGRGGRAVDYRCPLLPPREAKGATLIAPLDDAAVDNAPDSKTKGATEVAPLPERRNEGCERRNEGSAPTPLTLQPSLPNQDRGLPPDPLRAEGAQERSGQDLDLSNEGIVASELAKRSDPAGRRTPTAKDLKPDSKLKDGGGVSSPVAVDVTRTREDQADDLEAERRRQQDELMAWIRDHPEAGGSIADDSWPPREPADAACLPGPRGWPASRSTQPGRAVGSGASTTCSQSWPASSTRRQAQASRRWRNWPRLPVSASARSSAHSPGPGHRDCLSRPAAATGSATARPPRPAGGCWTAVLLKVPARHLNVPARTLKVPIRDLKVPSRLSRRTPSPASRRGTTARLPRRRSARCSPARTAGSAASRSTQPSPLTACTRPAHPTSPALPRHDRGGRYEPPSPSTAATGPPGPGRRPLRPRGAGRRVRPVPCRRSASGRAAAAQAPLATPSDTAAVERSALVSHAHERHQERQDFASRLSRADRVRLLERLDELADLDREMRRPGTLARPHSSPATAAEPESRRSQW